MRYRAVYQIFMKNYNYIDNYNYIALTLLIVGPLVTYTWGGVESDKLAASMVAMLASSLLKNASFSTCTVAWVTPHSLSNPITIVAARC